MTEKVNKEIVHPELLDEAGYSIAYPEISATRPPISNNAINNSTNIKLSLDGRNLYEKLPPPKRHPE